MSKPLDITNERFGKLTARLLVGKSKHGHMMWECTCECGGTTTTTATHLRTGHATSCGCQRGVRTVDPRPTMPRRPAVRPWLRLSAAEQAILQQRIDKMLIHAEMKQERVTA